MFSNFDHFINLSNEQQVGIYKMMTEEQLERFNANFYNWVSRGIRSDQYANAMMALKIQREYQQEMISFRSSIFSGLLCTVLISIIILEFVHK